ncbi:MAG TPA: oligosaccharide flippase family protein [Chlorobiota bacterium]|nr:oligosaccharide flippase family protein [Chlorobiota bacterium]
MASSSARIRSLASDTFIYGISTVVGRFLTFMLTPLYTNYLTQSEIGSVAALYAAIAFINIAYSLGMEPAFMRFYDKDDDAATASAFTIAFRSVLVLSAIVTVVTVVFADSIASSQFLQLTSPDAGWLVCIASLIPLGDALILMPFARLRMLRRPRQFMALRLLGIVVNVTLNIVFVVVLDWRIEGVLWAGVAAPASILLFFLRDIFVWARARWSQSLFREMLTFGMPTVPSSLSGIIVQVADRPIMLMLASSALVGVYQTNFRLALPMMMLVTVFEYAWRPFYLQHRDDEDAPTLFSRVLTLFTAASGVVFLVTALAMPDIVRLPFIGGRLVNPSYWWALDVVPIVLFAYWWNGVGIVLAAGFNIRKKTAHLPLATGAAAVVNVVMTLLLIPHVGITGGAWAKVAAYITSAAVLFALLPRVYPMKFDWRNIIVIVMSCSVVYLALRELLGSTILSAFVAVVTYVALLFLTRVFGTSMFSTLQSLVRRNG